MRGIRTLPTGTKRIFGRTDVVLRRATLLELRTERGRAAAGAGWTQLAEEPGGRTSDESGRSITNRLGR